MNDTFYPVRVEYKILFSGMYFLVPVCPTCHQANGFYYKGKLLGLSRCNLMLSLSVKTTSRRAEFPTLGCDRPVIFGLSQSSHSTKRRELHPTRRGFSLENVVVSYN